MSLNPARTIDLVLSKIAPYAERAGVDLGAIGPDSDLFALGILDSFDVVGILVSLEEDLGIEPLFSDRPSGAFVLSAKWISDGFLLGGQPKA
jgi:hypothetical protein